MSRRASDGAGLLAAFRAAVHNLEAHVDEINGLYVYPVPDGDTGSNMYATVKAALDVKYEAEINSAGIDRAVEAARKARASADSARAAQPSSIPRPAGHPTRRAPARSTAPSRCSARRRGWPPTRCSPPTCSA